MVQVAVGHTTSDLHLPDRHIVGVVVEAIVEATGVIMGDRLEDTEVVAVPMEVSLLIGIHVFL